MKTYRELYFKGNSQQLIKFVSDIGEYTTGDWIKVPTLDGWKEYLFFDYSGKEVDKARISIYLGNKIDDGVLNVGNIIPLEKSKLNIDEYNNVLIKFYNDVIKPYKETSVGLEISQPTDDVFHPTTVITEEALRKLKAFCNGANKSTGASHPCDRERWFDFICQTVDDNRMFDAETLAKFLQDENYWGEKTNGFIGVLGRYAWDEEKAYELASEYERLCEVIEYYKREKGIY